MVDDRPTFVVVLRPEKGTDPIRAMRGALKRLLRYHRLRAISVRQIEHPGDVASMQIDQSQARRAKSVRGFSDRKRCGLR
jgi:hypothetical protein